MGENCEPDAFKVVRAASDDFEVQEAEFTLKDVNDKVDVDNYLRCRGKAGCSRMDEDTVFVLPCKETLSA